MTYNQEQLEALQMVRQHLQALSEPEAAALRLRIGDYLAFREELDGFFAAHFTRICTEACFRSRLSACCGREGIVVFFADVVINALESTAWQLDDLERRLSAEPDGFKCVFLGDRGCRWQVRPIVCAMFLCDAATEKAFADRPASAGRWDDFQAQRRTFTWPDQPVLFDDLEQLFLRAGARSPLMYLNTSPGLLRVKQKAGLLPKPSPPRRAPSDDGFRLGRGSGGRHGGGPLTPGSKY